MNPPPLLRPATPADADAVMALQALAYGPALREPAQVMARRLAAPCGRCWLVEDADGPCAYLLANLTRLGHVTPLGGDFAAVARGDSLHLHDLAVAPRVAGQGLGGRLVARALQAPRPRRRCPGRPWWPCRARRRSGRHAAMRPRQAA